MTGLKKRVQKGERDLRCATILEGKDRLGAGIFGSSFSVGLCVSLSEGYKGPLSLLSSRFAFFFRCITSPLNECVLR